MFKSIGLPELLIVLAVIILLFGVGRISKISRELGSGIRTFNSMLACEIYSNRFGRNRIIGICIFFTHGSASEHPIPASA